MLSVSSGRWLLNTATCTWYLRYFSHEMKQSFDGVEEEPQLWLKLSR